MRIFAFAKSQKDVANEISRNTTKIMEHLIKVFLYPEATTQNGWKSEIYGFLNETPKLKGSHKFPSSKFIFDVTYGAYGDTLTSHIYRVKETISESPIDVTEEVLDRAIRAYFKYLSSELSSKGVTLPHQCYQKIEQIREEIIQGTVIL